MKQCEATTATSTYSVEHRCLKTCGVKPSSGRQLCAHHRAMHGRKTARA